MIRIKRQQQIAILIAASSMLACPLASADAVCDWNIKVGEIVVSARPRLTGRWLSPIPPFTRA